MTQEPWATWVRKCRASSYGTPSCHRRQRIRRLEPAPDVPCGTRLELELAVSAVGGDGTWQPSFVLRAGKPHVEIPQYGAITRHLRLTCVSRLLLAESVQHRRETTPL